ncbi:hypothetical protein ZOD2009_19623 [Haladaptatus paucihalophilus DX253]|uniref:DUF5658 domain-containing protein n=1 Tax=Haladaptatus paucihalophilus DX253 TaxID=797209 RepID=E7QYN4_HALPU|nr:MULTISPECIES: DUF5658 family protein [Haladaptatus]EFW90300.1 hypothetical protein ZOD2009_19623 [Haladaptatus paucihalophilus DX253]GKZ12181.1 hypothetical protein HAL_00620 [Haladaptatus sp. T7]SHK00544.1 hypothetical protein SAMN05444342_0249 [Haladaptatus paucihalophilus DX253]
MSHQQFSYRYQRTDWFDFGGIERLLWAVVILALVGDLLTTYAGLQAGLTESNPVARHALGQFGFLSLVGLKAFALGVGFVGRTLIPREYVALVPAGLALPWLFAVVVNLSLFFH